MVGVENCSDIPVGEEVMEMVGAENCNDTLVVVEEMVKGKVGGVVQCMEEGGEGVLYKIMGTEVEGNEVVEVKSIRMVVVEEVVNLVAEVMSKCMLVVVEEANLVEEVANLGAEVVVNCNSKVKGVEASEQAVEVVN